MQRFVSLARSFSLSFSKLDRVTANRSRGFLDDSTITSLSDDLGSEYTDTKSLDFSPERGRAAFPPRTNNLTSGNIVRDANIFETRSRDPSPQARSTVAGETAGGEKVY